MGAEEPALGLAFGWRNSRRSATLGLLFVIAALVLILAPLSRAAAQSCATYPNTLTNGTNADATQVMANFNCAALLGAANFTGPTSITGAAHTNRYSAFRTNGVARWELGADDGGEVGSNTGSNLYIFAHDDAGGGGAAGYVLQINRATGLTSLPKDVALGSANTNTITLAGHVVSTGTSPGVSSCGASPAVIGASNDNRGLVSNGSGTVTTCTITFSRAWTSMPFCTVSFAGGPPSGIALGVAPTTSTLQVSFSSSFNGSWFYMCQG